jgi:hypothetical protein
MHAYRINALQVSYSRRLKISLNLSFCIPLRDGVISRIKTAYHQVNLFIFLASILGISSLVILLPWSAAAEPLPSKTSNNNCGSTQECIPPRITRIQAQLIGPDFLTYENSTYGIKFQSPSNWNKTELLANRFDVIQLNSPPEDSSDRFQENIVITIEKGLPQNITLNDYMKLADEALNATYGNLNATGFTNAVMGGNNPAVTREFTMKQPFTGTDLKVSQIYTINNNTAYIIGYTAEASKFSQYLPIVQTLVGSFEIIK